MRELPPVADRCFCQFVSDANKTMLHPLDYRRFYLFVVVCHQLRVRAGGADVQALLTHAKFDDDCANSLAAIYEHGRRVLSLVSEATALRSRLSRQAKSSR